MSEAHSLKNKNGQYKPIITIKEARKLIGKRLSDQLPDEDLGRLIGAMSSLANRLLEARLVPQNKKDDII